MTFILRRLAFYAVAAWVALTANSSCRGPCRATRWT